jgi:hypothetical protein
MAAAAVVVVEQPDGVEVAVAGEVPVGAVEVDSRLLARKARQT